MPATKAQIASSKKRQVVLMDFMLESDPPPTMKDIVELYIREGFEVSLPTIKNDRRAALKIWGDNPETRREMFGELAYMLFTGARWAWANNSIQTMALATRELTKLYHLDEVIESDAAKIGEQVLDMFQRLGIGKDKE